EGDPSGPLVFGEPLVEILVDLGVPAGCLRAGRRTAQRLGEPFGDALGVVGRHVAVDGREERIRGEVTLIEEAGDTAQGWESAAPFEQGGGVVLFWLRVVEVDIPVHAAAERLVLRVAASAERVVLVGGAVVARQATVGDVGEGDTSRDSVRAVLGDFDVRRALVVPVDVATLLMSVDRVAEGSGRAIPNGADDLVHAPAAGRHEWLLVDPEHGRETVAA